MSLLIVIWAEVRYCFKGHRKDEPTEATKYAVRSIQ